MWTHELKKRSAKTLDMLKNKYPRRNINKDMSKRSKDIGCVIPHCNTTWDDATYPSTFLTHLYSEAELM